MEPFSSTTVGSEIHYQCQTGLLSEQRTTLLCGEDGTWNPDPQGLCAGKELSSCFAYLPYSSVLTPYILTTPGQSLSTPAAIAITAIVCLITGALFGALVTVCISRWNKKDRSSKPAPNTQEQQQAAVVYEEVDTLQSQKFELKENVAYGPVKQDQTFELKKNVAYEPVKPNQ